MKIKRILFIILMLSSTISFASLFRPFNMAYVEVNDNQLSNTGCFIRNEDNKPFFDMVGIFAANINGDDPNQPYIYFNPQVYQLMNHTQQVQELQHKGIKVLLTLLGNHQNAGWACMTDEESIKHFAGEIVSLVNRYHLDGIDIDDEYSRCQANNTSMIRIAQAIKQHPGFKNKVLTKALFADHQYFKSNYNGHKLAEFLDYGWEMNYGGNEQYRLTPYLGYGMDQKVLALGVSTNLSSVFAKMGAQFIIKNNYGGMMIYNLTRNSSDYLNELSIAEANQPIKVIDQCVK